MHCALAGYETLYFFESPQNRLCDFGLRNEKL